MYQYEKHPDAIYRQSFATIRSEADLSSLDVSDQVVAERMIHSCGQVDLIDDLVITPGARLAGTKALQSGVPILCDSAMIAAGLLSSITNLKVVKIREPETANLAREMGTTRSAAQVDTWLPIMAGSIILIGNAPTALFRLLELLTLNPHKMPSLLVACPVGFVGAAESKEALVKFSPAFPFITLTGRRGGTPMTAAALNACSVEAHS